MRPRNHVLDVQNRAHVLRNELAIGVRDALRLVDEDAQNPAVAAAQQLDVDNLDAFAGAYALRNFPHFFHHRRPVRHAVPASSRRLLKGKQ